MTSEQKELYDMTLAAIKQNHIVVSNCADSSCATSITSTQCDRCQEAKKYATDMTMHELRQSVEGLYHNLNTLN